ncbi:hypothetical protein [Prosthecomicrobium sp. N25]|uniref:hypothetical protein n=1 Tax=Prosthecomicrobium sp. N25 TaxID=3129254 RepID=UPI0030781797
MNPDSMALLTMASTVLRGVAPQLNGDERYAVLLAANAVDTARRDAVAGDRSDAAGFAPPPDPAAIRSGLHDDDAALYRRLMARSVVLAWIANPSSVTDAERAAHLGGLA